MMCTYSHNSFIGHFYFENFSITVLALTAPVILTIGDSIKLSLYGAELA